jgi:hypothetical protein
MPELQHRILFTAYQWIMSLAILPICYLAWYEKLDKRHDLTILVFIVPVVFGYVVPGVGTNLLKLWEFNAGVKMGRFTVLHGIVFGASCGLLSLLCCDILLVKSSPFSMLKSAHVCGVVICFWNWIFDVYALHSGIAVIYNKPRALGKSCLSIASDYAPVYFGAFGICYGIHISILCTLRPLWNSLEFWVLALCSTMTSITVPIAAHSISSYLRHGYSGLLPYTSKNNHFEKGRQ